jgi:hypothetical protein
VAGLPSINLWSRLRMWVLDGTLWRDNQDERVRQSG